MDNDTGEIWGRTNVARDQRCAGEMYILGLEERRVREQTVCSTQSFVR